MTIHSHSTSVAGGVSTTTTATTYITTTEDTRTALINNQYFVDPVGGDDGYSGHQGSPWKTIAKVNAAALVPGDQVLFKRGETFTGRLIPTTSGDVNRYILYGIYGAGARPIIDGVGTNAAFYISGATPNYLWIESIDFYRSNSTSTFYCADGAHDIYIYDCIIRNSTTNTSGCYLGGYNLTMDTCVFRNNYRSGLLANDLTNHNILVINCTAYSNGHDIWAHHGMYIAGGVTLDNCVAYSNSAAGFKLNDNYDELFIEPTYYPIVKNSISYSQPIGILLTHKNAAAINNLVYSNTVYNLEIDGNPFGGYVVYYNTIVNGTSATYRGVVQTAGLAAGSVFKNNLFINDTAVVTRGCIHFDDTTFAQWAAMFDYNTYYCNGNPASTVFGYDSAGTKTWANWQSAGAEAHGTFLTGVPDFVTRYTDLHPANAGNLKALGLCMLGYQQDRSGNYHAEPPTPGCYEESA